MVRVTRPVKRASSKGVFLHFDRNLSGSTTQGVSVSMTMTSAGAPARSVPAFNPSNSAGRGPPMSGDDVLCGTQYVVACGEVHAAVLVAHRQLDSCATSPAP